MTKSKNLESSYYTKLNSLIKEEKKKFKYKGKISLLLSILKRLFNVWVTIPATFFFAFFLIEGTFNGFVPMYNNWVINARPIIDATSLIGFIELWFYFGLVMFSFSWFFFPWKSPARKAAQERLKHWFYVNGGEVNKYNEISSRKLFFTLVK